MMAADDAKLAAAAGLPNAPRPSVAASSDDRSGTLPGQQHESPWGPHAGLGNKEVAYFSCSFTFADNVNGLRMAVTHALDMCGADAHLNVCSSDACPPVLLLLLLLLANCRLTPAPAAAANFPASCPSLLKAACIRWE
jgi:hypothetical protein